MVSARLLSGHLSHRLWDAALRPRWSHCPAAPPSPAQMCSPACSWRHPPEAQPCTPCILRPLHLALPCPRNSSTHPPFTTRCTPMPSASCSPTSATPLHPTALAPLALCTPSCYALTPCPHLCGLAKSRSLSGAGDVIGICQLTTPQIKIHGVLTTKGLSLLSTDLFLPREYKIWLSSSASCPWGNWGTG